MSEIKLNCNLTTSYMVQISHGFHVGPLAQDSNLESTPLILTFDFDSSNFGRIGKQQMIILAILKIEWLKIVISHLG